MVSRRVVGALVVGSAALINALIFYRVSLLSGFDSLPGDLGDGRFNLAVLEHWYRVALGAESWTSPDWYYPQAGVLGYSDALALLAPPYVVARLAGFGLIQALAAALATASVLGFAGMVVVLRGQLRLVWPATLAGASAFAFGTGLYESLAVGHVQMMAVQALPWFAAFTLLFLRRAQPKWGVAAAVMLASLLSSAFYVGWFVGTQLLVIGVLVVISRPGPTWTWLVSHWRPLALAALALALALAPFCWLYGPVALHSPPRPWEEVVRTLPSLSQLVEARGNAMWGPVAETLWPGLSRRGGEMGKAPGWILLTIFGITLGWLAVRRRDIPPETRRLALVLGGSVVVCWLAMLQVDGISAWSAVYRWLPGGHSIRSVFRFNLVLAFSVAVVAAIGLQWAWTRAGPRGRVAVGLLALAIMAEQVNVMPTTLSQSRDFAVISAVPPAPADCRAFVLLETMPPSEYQRWSRQLNAVMLAQAQGLPTLNGYSGLAPPGWDLFDPTDAPRYRRALVQWADSHGLWPGLCGLDLSNRRWSPLTRADFP